MKSSIYSILLLAAALLSGSIQSAPADDVFRFHDGDRVILLGDTFFERAQRYGWLETAIQLRFPNENLQFRNLGWSGDTVFAESRGIFDPPAKGYARMLEQVRDLNPTVIFLNYGGNEAFQGPAYIETFVKQYSQLLDDLASTKARFVLVSPLPLFDAGAPLPSPESHNQIRGQFAAAVRELARERSLHYVDLWTPLNRKVVNSDTQLMTEEGVHLTDFGYGIVSTVFVQALTGDELSKTPEVQLGSETANAQPPIQQKKYTAQKASRSFEAAIESDSSVAGIRLSADGLEPGTYEIRVNGNTRGSLSSLQLKGSVLSEFGSVSMLAHEDLRQTIIEKNQMYFHRWRPQNVTYLFLFRKHEQGNNAGEVDEFLPIISRLEKKISDLKQSAPRVRIELVRKNTGVDKSTSQ